jgi:hypothetical protein
VALSTVISGGRPSHRTARAALESFQGALALDWANGQAIACSASSQQSTAFDATNDRIVMCSVGGASSAGGCWISVGTNPTASAGAGSMWIAQASAPTPVYVPAAALIAAVQGQTSGTLSMIPALLASGG